MILKTMRSDSPHPLFLRLRAEENMFCSVVDGSSSSLFLFFRFVCQFYENYRAISSNAFSLEHKKVFGTIVSLTYTQNKKAFQKLGLKNYFKKKFCSANMVFEPNFTWITSGYGASKMFKYFLYIPMCIPVMKYDEWRNLLRKNLQRAGCVGRRLAPMIFLVLFAHFRDIFRKFFSLPFRRSLQGALGHVSHTHGYRTIANI